MILSIWRPRTGKNKSLVIDIIVVIMLSELNGRKSGKLQGHWKHYIPWSWLWFYRCVCLCVCIYLLICTLMSCAIYCMEVNNFFFLKLGIGNSSQLLSYLKESDLKSNCNCPFSPKVARKTDSQTHVKPCYSLKYLGRHTPRQD